MLSNPSTHGWAHLAPSAAFLMGWDLVMSVYCLKQVCSKDHLNAHRPHAWLNKQEAGKDGMTGSCGLKGSSTDKQATSKRELTAARTEWKLSREGLLGDRKKHLEGMGRCQAWGLGCALQGCFDKAKLTEYHSQGSKIGPHHQRKGQNMTL